MVGEESHTFFSMGLMPLKRGSHASLVYTIFIRFYANIMGNNLTILFYTILEK
jgi:hypothetical protein